MDGSAPRAVLDTNVLVSGVLFDGAPATLLESARSGLLHGVTSLYVLEQFQAVLQRPKFEIGPSLAQTLALQIAAFNDVLPLEESSNRGWTDPADDPVIETALVGGVAYLVTGDKVLLQVELPGLEVVNVAEMLEILGFKA